MFDPNIASLTCRVSRKFSSESSLTFVLIIQAFSEIFFYVDDIPLYISLKLPSQIGVIWVDV